MSKREGNSGEFEQSWKSAFSGAEVTPPSHIWSEIDHSLTQTQLSTLQKKTAVYKWTAAAAVIIAASLGVMALSFNYSEIAGWFGNDTGDQSLELVAQLDENEDQTNKGNYAGFSILRDDNNRSATNESESEVSKPITVPATNTFLASEEVAPAQSLITTRTTYRLVARLDQFDLSSDQTFPHDQEINLSLASPKIARPANGVLVNKPTGDLLAANTPDPASFGVNGVVVNDVKRPILDSKGKTRFWSGVDVVSGYFNPNYGPGNFTTSQDQLIKDASSRESVPELSENIRGGASYSIGINFGMDLKDRWSLEIGVLYSLLGARTFTNLILESEGFNNAVAYSSEIAGLESVANLVESELTKLSVDDIQINNTFQFISFPVQAGYKLIDKRFNVTLNGGLAANLYLGNSLRGRSNLSSFELEPGRRSPYRSLTLAAVAGFEIGYWIHRRVNLSFEPTYQKNLQSLTKNDAGFVANPSGVGVQVGFKYDF